MRLWRKTIEPARPLPDVSHEGGVWPPSRRWAALPGRAAGHASASPARTRASRPWRHLLLFCLTLFSVAAAGAMQQGVNPLQSLSALVHLVEGLPFAGTLLGILAVHEFGHYFAARRWGVGATLPYFMPLPYSFLGTLGAVIRIQSPIPHKRALLDIGAAGPLSGLVVAVAACVIGLPQSEVVPSGYFDAALRGEPIQLGAPLLFSWLSGWLLPEVGADETLLLGPVAFAGWVGLFITAFNLLPVGQLDGGHIAYALFGRWHRHLGRVTFAALLALGTYGIFSLVWDLPRGWLGWLLLAFLLTLFGRHHPPPLNPHIALDPWRRLVGLVCLVVFVLCFTPAPFSVFGS